MKIFLSVGEPSGDLHGANLAKHLEKRLPGVKISGFGGPKMRAAGVEQLYPLSEHAVIGFLNVAMQYPFFVKRVKQAAAWMDKEKPDAVVLIDFPGMNWHIARKATERGIPVFYFVPPQLWAWAGWRVEKMKRWVVEALTNFPFEDKWFRSKGMPSTLVGHPYFDELDHQKLDMEVVRKIQDSGTTIIGMLPGSRGGELSHNVPTMLQTAEILVAKHPGVRFHFACYKAKQADWVRAKIAEKPRWASLPIEIHSGNTPEVIEASRFLIAVSGSVSLEFLWRTKPFVTIYQTTWFNMQLVKLLKKCQFISLINLLSEKEVLPEFMDYKCQSQSLARVCLSWLGEPAKIDELREKLTVLRAKWAIPGACERAANHLVDRIQNQVSLFPIPLN
ncbi:MAG: lipid-A-disaccharide synthase [Planctomycetota bacterium]|nr:MAG: lipid-A-disaccharide synthase [Planctomycetota bacterium]